MKKKFIYLASILLFLGGCQSEDVIAEDPIDETLPTELSTLSIPESFDWSSTSTLALTISVDDKYTDKNYIVEVFDDNPVFNTKAGLLAKGLAKSSEVFTANVTIPKALTTIYVKQTDPKGKQVVLEYDTQNTPLAISFKTVATKSKVSSNSLRSEDEEVEEGIETPEKAVVIDNNVKSYLLDQAKSKYYVIRGSYKGTLEFKGNGRGVELYVEGEWNNALSDLNLKLEEGDKIVIQPKGRVSSDKLLNISMSNASKIFVSQGAVFGQGEGYKTIKINASNNNEHLINHGTVSIAQITRIRKIHNTGLMSCQNLGLDTGTSVVENRREMRLENAEVVNATINNKCLMNVTGKLRLVNTPINLSEGALLRTKYLYTGGAAINLQSHAILDVTEQADFETNASKIVGVGEKYALVRFAKQLSGGWISVEYSGRVEVECSDHSKNQQYTKAYTLDSKSGARIVPKGSATVVIEKSECNGGEGNEVKDDGEFEDGHEYPLAVNLGTPHTYLFEDTYPSTGDYDMNDFVTTVNYSYSLSAPNKVSQIELLLTIRATGATKRIAAAIQLDGIARSAVREVVRSGYDLKDDLFLVSNGIEEKQTYAVIPITDDVHGTLGTPHKYSFINTKLENAHKPEKDIKLTITFANPVDFSAINIVEMVNLFIINKNFKSDIRREVHLKNYKATDRSKDISLGGNYTTRKNFMYGMRIPGVFVYPKEFTNIIYAYKDFSSWVTSGGIQKQDWYIRSTAGTIYNKQ
ncbi:MAG: hypothetical protein RL662_1182 [Bacteroidota bacterium]|jgi:LruC domain-containing protein